MTCMDVEIAVQICGGIEFINLHCFWIRYYCLGTGHDKQMSGYAVYEIQLIQYIA
jgi:hypothetical protein